MNRSPLALLPLLPLLLGACRTLPPVVSAPPSSAAQIEQRCLAHFVPGPWRVVHRIEARMPFGNAGSFLGATASGAPPERGLHSAMISVEGVTLFEATSTGGPLKVLRAVPPMDRPGFGPGLMADVAFMLLPPEGRAAQVGTLEGGQAVCRWSVPAGRTIDLIEERGGGWRLRDYDEDFRPVRELEVEPLTRDGFPVRMTLSSPGLGGYSLTLTLLEAELGAAPSGT